MDFDGTGVLARSLPLNRKERFYTGTVLPGIIWGPELRSFVSLAGRPDVAARMGAAGSRVVLYTEYDLFDALRHEAARLGPGRRIRPDCDEAGASSDEEATDTPDLVLHVAQPSGGVDLLIVVEAKMFSRPSYSQLARQMRRQRVAIIDLLRKTQGFRRFEALQVALLPEQLIEEIAPAKARGQLAAMLDREVAGPPTPVREADAVAVMTWQELHDKFADIPSAHDWNTVLAGALRHYHELRAPRPSQPEMSGRQICAALASDSFGNRCIGRKGGLAAFHRDLDENPNWRRRRYKIAEGEDIAEGDRAIRYFGPAAFLAALAERGILLQGGARRAG